MKEKHPKEIIKELDCVFALNCEGYKLTSKIKWFQRVYCLEHREFDYPLFEDKNPYFVIAKGLSYVSYIRQGSVENFHNK